MPPQAIVDGHCHVASTRFIPPSFVEASAENICARLAGEGVSVGPEKVVDLYLEKLQDHDCDELAAEMTHAGIETSVLLVPDLTFALPDAELSIAEMLDLHHKIVVRHPGRFAVFAGVDPRWGNDGVALFEKSVKANGFRGFKVYPPCGYSASDPGLYPFYEICAELRLPVVVHVGGTSPALSFEFSRPVDVDRAAKDFPRVSFVLAHGATAYTEEAAMMCLFRPNVFLDVSAFQARPFDFLQRVFGLGINHKVVFGTDWPLFRFQGRQKDVVESLGAPNGPLAGIRGRDREAFFGGTMRRLLGEA